MPTKRRIPIVKDCEQCGEPFKPRPDRAHKIRFCCRVCLRQSQRQAAQSYGVYKNCVKCGKEFRVPPSHADQKHCSMACTRSAITKQCERCGKVFIIHAFRSEFKGTQKFTITCGNKCPMQFITKQCLLCGKDFKAKWNHKERRKYCSYQCNGKTRAMPASEKRGGRATAEGFFTKQEWLDLCDHYGHKCLACGKIVRLTVDHIVPVSRGGSNYISNIQPLCKSCNSSKGTKVIDYRAGHTTQ